MEIYVSKQVPFLKIISLLRDHIKILDTRETEQYNILHVELKKVIDWLSVFKDYPYHITFYKDIAIIHYISEM